MPFKKLTKKRRGGQSADDLVGKVNDVAKSVDELTEKVNALKLNISKFNETTQGINLLKEPLSKIDNKVTTTPGDDEFFDAVQGPPTPSPSSDFSLEEPPSSSLAISPSILDQNIVVENYNGKVSGLIQMINVKISQLGRGKNGRYDQNISNLKTLITKIKNANNVDEVVNLTKGLIKNGKIMGGKTKKRGGKNNKKTKRA
jgi:hypothetical protein